MKYIYSILFFIMIIFIPFIISTEVVGVELKGILLTKEPKLINSPWGQLKNNVLLLNEPKKIIPSKDKLNISFAILYLNKEWATNFDGNLKITNLWRAKTKLKVKMFQDLNTRKWCVTDGFIAYTNNEIAVFNGLIISITGGKESPVIINGKPYSDSVVEIKDGDAYKINSLNNP